MRIASTRFGTIQVEPEHLIEFPEGIIGFSKIKTYILLEEKSSVFLWLQAVSKPDVAFPILEPEIFHSNYRVGIHEEDLESLKIDTADHLKVITIVTIPPDITQITANLRAPIFINLKEKIGRQIILEDEKHPIRYSIFESLNHYINSLNKQLFCDDKKSNYSPMMIEENLRPPQEIHASDQSK